jgi:hypothetical protein
MSQNGAVTRAEAPPPAEKTGQDTDRLHVWAKCWEFFWRGLTAKQKWVLVGILVAVLGVVVNVSFWGAYYLQAKLSESKVDAADARAERQAAEYERKLSACQSQLSDAKRDRRGKETSTTGDAPTIETAPFDPIGYAEFLSRLNRARQEGDPAKSALLARYRWKKLRWECVILDVRSEDSAYFVGPSEDAIEKDRTFARFDEPRQFDAFAKRGDRVTIEGVFETADNTGIVLYDCRFPSDATNAIKSHE